MSDDNSLFYAPAAEIPNKPKPMSGRQRDALRAAFSVLGVDAARDQFALVKSLTGLAIRSPSQLTETQARSLLMLLRRRLELVGRTTSGNTWADREEDTWIDKL